MSILLKILPVISQLVSAVLDQFNQHFFSVLIDVISRLYSKTRRRGIHVNNSVLLKRERSFILLIMSKVWQIHIGIFK
jgi:hypothetical protein